MKNNRILLFFGCMTLLIASCHKDECEQSGAICGEWIWEKSVGGFGGWTETPASKGVAKKLKISDFTFESYVNDSLVFQSGYDLEIRPDTSFGTNTYIKFEQGGEQAILIKATRLELYDLCADCFMHSYVRK